MYGRSRGHRFGLIMTLLALCVCYVVTTIHDRSSRAHHQDPLTGAVRDAAIIPALSASASWAHWWTAHVTSLFQGPELSKSNASLQRQVVELSRSNELLSGQQEENVRLRELLHFSVTSPKPLLPGEVIALKPSASADTLTTDRGTADGVKVHAVVLAPNGALVGQVYQTSPNASDVLLLTDSQSSVGATVIEPNGSETSGICRGDRSGTLKVNYLQSDANIAVGDKVVSAGLGTIFPKGIPIGIVTKVKVDSARSMKIADVKPAADLDRIQDALILR